MRDLVRQTALFVQAWINAPAEEAATTLLYVVIIWFALKWVYRKAFK